MAGDITGKIILDLCCGNGRLSRSVLKRNPRHLWAVDESNSMLNWDVPYEDSIFKKWTMNVEEFFVSVPRIKFNVIFCQQAVNYWFDSKKVSLIKKLLAPNGLFIFNTFHNKPSEIPLVKTYRMGGRDYAETSWLVGDMVKHVQIAEGMDPHFTEFRWISPGEFRGSFKKHDFKVSVKKYGGTDIYVCKK
jgi:SAM-dependent methyltransferase